VDLDNGSNLIMYTGATSV